jgi:co-chaperonin GroES (HSP10)
MLQRCFAVLTVLAVVALLVAVTPALAADKTHEGKIVKAGDGKLTMSDEKGENKHTHIVKPGTAITRDGKECKLEDLKEGDHVTVTTRDDAVNTVVKIEAREKK